MPTMQASKSPAYSIGKDQLNEIEVEQTGTIASVHIRVKHVIGNIRQRYSFSVLHNQLIMCSLDAETVTMLDKMVRCAWALINMYDSVILFD